MTIVQTFGRWLADEITFDQMTDIIKKELNDDEEKEHEAAFDEKDGGNLNE